MHLDELLRQMEPEPRAVLAPVVTARALEPLEQAAQSRFERLGVIESVEEREPGVASVSAAVASSVVSSVGSPRGAVIAAVSISGPIERLSRQPGDRFGAAVVGCAAELTAALATSSL